MCDQIKNNKARKCEQKRWKEYKDQASLCIRHALKRKAQREVTNLHLDHHLLSGFTASDVYVCFHSAKKNLFTNLNVHAWFLCEAVFLCLCLCVSTHACVRGQEWRCYPLVIHHMRDTLSPALRYAEAMFYKRITRQRAPTGHPLPPCATCKMYNGLTDYTALHSCRLHI